MGIAFKDLKVGSIYKGYHAPAPHGAKCFYFVTQIYTASGSGAATSVELRYILRRAATQTWSPLIVHQGLPQTESLMKQVSGRGDLIAENLPIPPPPPTKPAAAPPTSPPPVLGSPKGPTAAERDAAARAKRNEGKVIIPENARSPRCVKCGGANKLVALFAFSAYHCTACEPQ